MKTEVYKKGHVLFRESDDSNEMYYIDSGSVAILCKNANGETVPVSILKKGSFLGEFAFFDNTSRSATAMVLEDTRVKIINRSTINSVGKNGVFIIQALIKKLKNMNDLLMREDEAA